MWKQHHKPYPRCRFTYTLQCVIVDIPQDTADDAMTMVGAAEHSMPLNKLILLWKILEKDCRKRNLKQNNKLESTWWECWADV